MGMDLYEIAIGASAKENFADLRLAKEGLASHDLAKEALNIQKLGYDAINNMTGGKNI